jgi:hypothetical protein
MTPANDQGRLIESFLALLRNATAKSNPAMQFRPAVGPKDTLPSETSVQQGRTGSLGDQRESMVAVAFSESTLTEAPSPSLQHRLATEPLVQDDLSVSRINETQSMVAVAVAETVVTEAPSPSLQQPIARPISKGAPTEPSVQEEKTGSLIKQMLSMVEIVAAESKFFEVDSPSLQQPELKAVEVTPPASEQPIAASSPLAEKSTAEERLDVERAAIRQRVETFKANQWRFQREREEYYETTMAKARCAPTKP